MWLNSRAKWGAFLFFVSLSLVSNAQQSKVIYNLRQNWVQYNENSKGYLPVISNDPGQTLSFELDCNSYKGKELFIYPGSAKSYLFFNNQLISELSPKGSFYDIDSLSDRLGGKMLFLSLYSSVPPNANTQTYIVEKGFRYESKEAKHAQDRSTAFTAYFIVVSILLYLGLVLIKLRYPELYNQYASLQRSLNPQTIDELIYKGRFFAIPGVIMIFWISLTTGFVLSYLLNKLDIMAYVPGFSNWSLSYPVLWLLFSVIFFITYLLRYGLISAMSVVFDMSAIRNIHFANLLRLTYYLLILLLVVTTLDYFSVVHLSEQLLLWLIFGSLFLIIVLVGIRLSLIIRHTFVHLFLYLCATEIFLFAFVYKLVVG
ncbi:MAG: DUF4271 domain-containing protein [Cyclobacteriaceae bacterium]|nr:DUF4271 domain-containing protein [Cyclobacteriaceae bacterium]